MLSASVRPIARGLKRERDTSFRFHNFANRDILLIILTLEGWSSQFLQAAVLSFLFSLRVPSETLLLHRAFGDEPIIAFTKQSTKARIGVRIANNIPILVIKFSFRMNLPRGCTIRRPCICTMRGTRPQPFCPIHAIWEIIRRRVRPGGALVPALSSRNFNPMTKRVFAKAAIPDAERFPPHCFRRGATQALKNSQASARLLAGSGAWNSRAVLGYVDLTQDESAELSAVLLDPSLSSDSEDDLLPSRAAVRKRILRLPQLSAALPKGNDDASEEDDDLTSTYSSGNEAA